MEERIYSYMNFFVSKFGRKKLIQSFSMSEKMSEL